MACRRQSPEKSSLDFGVALALSLRSARARHCGDDHSESFFFREINVEAAFMSEN
jgi:hypothetical protein